MFKGRLGKMYAVSNRSRGIWTVAAGRCALWENLPLYNQNTIKNETNITKILEKNHNIVYYDKNEINMVNK